MITVTVTTQVVFKDEIECLRYEAHPDFLTDFLTAEIKTARESGKPVVLQTPLHDFDTTAVSTISWDKIGE